MILAAGVGSRLDPLTQGLPKPLCPILGKPVMEHIVDLCKKHGFVNLAANTHVLANKIKEHFRDSDKKFGVNLNLVHEPELTGIAGGIRSCKKYLTDDVVLVIMGDALTDVNLTRLYEAHIKGNCPVTIGIKEVEDTRQYGVVVTDRNSRVVSFQEKPKPHEAKSNLANTAIYFFNQNILNEIPPQEEAPFYDVATDLFKRLMSKNIPIQAVNIDAYWADIGTLKQYQESIKDAFDGRVKIEIKKGIKGKVYFADDVKIGENVVIKDYVYIEKNCEIQDGSYIDNSIIWSGSKIGKNVKIINSILGNNCRVNDGTEMISNSVWAPDTLIQNGSKPAVVLT